MNLNDAFLRVTIETEAQAEAVLSSPSVGLIWLDAGFFAPSSWKAFCQRAHAAGKRCGLRLPQIWRREATDFFAAQQQALRDAGFDALLLGSLESLGFLEQAEIRLPLAFDASIYDFSGFADEALRQVVNLSAEHAADVSGKASAGDTAAGLAYPSVVQTLPLELSARELAPLCAEIENAGRKAELVVYGRTRMMLTAQCIRRTVLGCDKRPVVMELRDRTGARLSVKNCCRFCENRIYNAVPTLLCDERAALNKLCHSFERCDFTVETAEETAAILAFYDAPERAQKPKAFTRGYWKRGVL